MAALWVCLASFTGALHVHPFACQAVYTTLREAEYRSLTFIPYWKIPPLAALVPRQRACKEALQVINESLDGLIAKSYKMVSILLCMCSSCGCYE